MALFDDVMQGSCASEHTRYEFNRRFVLQTIVDSLAYAEDTSGRILNLRALFKFGDTIRQLLANEDIRTLWRKRQGTNTTNLDEKFAEVFESEESAGRFFEDLVANATRGFAQICDYINGHVNATAEKRNDVTIEEKIEKKSEAELIQSLEEDIGAFVESNEIFKKSNISQNKLELMLFLLPHLEQCVWLTDTSHSRPFHSLLRMNEYWRLLVFAWVYSKRHEIESIPAESSASKELTDFVGITDCSSLTVHRLSKDWPAPGSEDTELGVLMEPEVGHGEAEVYTRVQA